MIRRVLGVPLVAKLIGANVLIVASAIILQGIAFDGRRAEMIALLIALTAALIVNLFLVRLALKPIKDLEDLAQRVSAGEFEARGVASLFADKDLARLRETVNDLLDALAAERKRIQDLGAQVVEAQDSERASMSRELHDSIAQTLAAVRLQLAAAGREDHLGEMKNRLVAANGMISAAMDEIMSVSYSLHSRVAEDLGIEAALQTLGNQVMRRSDIDVVVDVRYGARSNATTMSGSIASTLYRVAEEALRSLELERTADSVLVNLYVSDSIAQIEILAYGEDSSEVALTPGLISVKDRVLLAGGKMSIDKAPAGGMRVTAELRTLRAAS